MGITFARTRLTNARGGKRALDVEMVVDTGAIFSVVPRDVLKKLGVRSQEDDEFTLADGSTVRYPVGEAHFELEGRQGTSKVVFGPVGGTPLLGALALETLGLMVNPVTRELRPMRLILAAGAGRRPRVRRR